MGTVALHKRVVSDGSQRGLGVEGGERAFGAPNASRVPVSCWREAPCERLAYHSTFILRVAHAVNTVAHVELKEGRLLSAPCRLSTDRHQPLPLFNLAR